MQGSTTAPKLMKLNSHTCFRCQNQKTLTHEWVFGSRFKRINLHYSQRHGSSKRIIHNKCADVPHYLRLCHLQSPSIVQGPKLSPIKPCYHWMIDVAQLFTGYRKLPSFHDKKIWFFFACLRQLESNVLLQFNIQKQLNFLLS